MTIDELKAHIRAVVDYTMPNELRDAAENGVEGHIVNHLIALDNFLGAEWDHSEVTDPEDDGDTSRAEYNANPECRE